MTEVNKPFEMITDYVTGKSIPDIGAEANRQAVEHYLVDEKGYDRSDIAVNMPISFNIGGDIYQSVLDLVVSVDQRPFMVIKCAAGSLDSRQKEVVSAARILEDHIIPYAAVSDGQTALLYDAVSAKQIGEGLNALPDPQKVRQMLKQIAKTRLPEKRLEKERLIFRSYDTMNVNVKRQASAEQITQ